MHVERLAGDADLAAELLAGARHALLVGVSVIRTHDAAAPAKDRQRDIHVVDQVHWRRPVQRPPDSKDRTVRPHDRPSGALQCLDVLFQSPVERSSLRGRIAVRPGIKQMAAHGANCRVSEWRQQARDCIGCEHHVGVAEHQQVGVGLAHQHVHAVRLAVTAGRGDEA